MQLCEPCLRRDSDSLRGERPWKSRIGRSAVGDLAAFDILQFEMKKIWLRLQVSITFNYREQNYFSVNKVIIGDPVSYVGAEAEMLRR